MNSGLQPLNSGLPSIKLERSAWLPSRKVQAQPEATQKTHAGVTHMKTAASPQASDTVRLSQTPADRLRDVTIAPLPPVEELDKRRKQLQSDIDSLRSEIRIREATEMFFH